MDGTDGTSQQFFFALILLRIENHKPLLDLENISLLLLFALPKIKFAAPDKWQWLSNWCSLSVEQLRGWLSQVLPALQPTNFHIYNVAAAY